MDILLPPRPIGGEIRAVASKSHAHRLLICAALSDRATHIVCGELSKDIEATVRCLNALGADIVYADGRFRVEPIRTAKSAVLDCGECGATLRFLLPIVAALGVDGEFVMHGRLSERPIGPLIDLLECKGITITRPETNRLCVSGRLCGGTFPMAADLSSQFLSGLLLALPLLDEESDIMLTTELCSSPYIDLTLATLRRFGITAVATSQGWHLPKQCYRSCGTAAVEGDWSNAAFWLCAGAFCAPMRVTGLDPLSPQGDRRILDLLRRFGAHVLSDEGGITVVPSKLHGIDIDASDIPDLVPPLALVACCAAGTTNIYRAARLRQKESDRLVSIAQALRSIGGKVTVTDDGLKIDGCALQGGRIDSFADHRIAMLAGIASAACLTPIRLHGAQAVEKSYLDFWNALESLVI